MNRILTLSAAALMSVSTAAFAQDAIKADGPGLQVKTITVDTEAANVTTPEALAKWERLSADMTTFLRAAYAETLDTTGATIDVVVNNFMLGTPDTAMLSGVVTVISGADTNTYDISVNGEDAAVAKEEVPIVSPVAAEDELYTYLVHAFAEKTEGTVQ